MSTFEGRILVSGGGSTGISEVMMTTVGLSFWGGIDPLTGIVVDVGHPWHGQNVANKIMCLPSGRGSSTASQVLLELIRNDKAPAAMILRDADAMACIGALIAASVFELKVPDIICLGGEKYNMLMQSEAILGLVNTGGQLMVANTEQELSDIFEITKTTQATPTPITLNQEEQNMMDSTLNEGQRMALKVLIAYAHITSPENPTYIDIEQVHVDGCTYIGPGGLEYVNRLVAAGARARVPTTLNAGSTDRYRWKALGVPSAYAHNAIALGDAYLKLGCQLSFTCAPYLLEDPPKLGQNIAWGESNAVVYANTVLGAKTEKYADYLDICCAITGKTVATGVHMKENRQPRIILDATELLAQLWEQRETSGIDALFPILGHLCGSLSDGQIPILLGMENWKGFVTTDHLKAFCAAYGTTGVSPLIHISGITPEADHSEIVQCLLANSGGKTRKLSFDDLLSTYKVLDSSAANTKIDLVALGNPHLSISECETLADIVTKLKSKRNDSTRIMACMSRELYSEANERGHIAPLEQFGMEFVNDTCWCMLLDPPVIPVHKNSTIMTNSGKYAHYGPGLTQRSFRFGSMFDCVQAAVTGTYNSSTQQSIPRWLGTGQQRSHSTGTAINVARQLLRRKCVP